MCKDAAPAAGTFYQQHSDETITCLAQFLGDLLWADWIHLAFSIGSELLDCQLMSSCAAGLAVAAQLFDMACLTQIGLSLNSMALIMMSGYITTALRQVCTEGPLIDAS